MACKYLYKGKYYTEEELASLPDFAKLQRERDQVNDNTGENSHEIINFFPAGVTPGDQTTSGVFQKFIQFKRTQLYEYQRRLDTIKRDKKKRNITTDELNKFNKLERELKLQVEGNHELNIKGLKQEIKELEISANTNAVGYYAEKDLQRLDKLANSSDIDDLREAQRIVDFYTLSGTFERGIENPFFTQEEIFLTDDQDKLTAEYRLSDETMNGFRQWKDKAKFSQNIINKRKQEATENTINNDPSVRKTYRDKQFSFDELVNSNTGLKDVDWISMWTMDITQGLFSTNGIIPQAMFSYLTNSFEKKLAWSREIEEKIDKLNPGVQTELTKLGYTLRGAGILGIKGASFQLFKEITKQGNETGGIVQRFIKEYFDSESLAKNKFNKTFNEAKLYQDYNLKSREFNKAFEELKKWRRNNTIIIDPSKIPELLKTSTLEADAYRKSLIDVLGEKGYNEQIIKQKNLINKYDSDKQSMLETLLQTEGKDKYDDLSAASKSDLSHWENNHSIDKAIEDYNSVSGISFDDRKANNFMYYNVFVPRKFKVNITANSTTNQYQFTDTNISTGFYSKEFAEIESNPILSEYYDVIKEVTDTIRENIPYELQRKMAVNTLPALMKTSAEMIADKNTGILSSLYLAFRHMLERIRIGFGVIKQSEVSYATVDPITSKANYKVNDQFLQGNIAAVEQRTTIEKYKFIQSYNSTIPNKDNKLSTIRRFSTVNMANINTPTLYLLAEYLHLDKTSINLKKDIEAITGNNIEIGKYIRDYSLHTVVQSQSFDLSKIAKYYSNIAMAYAARQEALPILEIMKSHYEAIKKPVTNNLGNSVYNNNEQQFMKDGFRTNAMRQMDDWFERVALDNYGTKHIGPHGIENITSKRLQKIDNRLKEIDDLLSSAMPQSMKDKLIPERERLMIKRIIPNTYGKDIYTEEEKKKILEIETLLVDETNDVKRAELIKIREKLGRVRTTTALFDNLLAWIRTLRLGYNISSASTNFLEGVTSNMILGATGDYFDSKEIYPAYNIVKQSFIKNLTFGTVEVGQSRKNRKLMDKFNVIMDSKNELQKSSVKSYANKLSWLNPHELNQRVEFINQSPVMIAILRTLKIKDKNNNESSIWDAMNKDGHLKDEFKTETNIDNWENLTGADYLAFKQRLHKAIVLGHGNYDELRGMMIKSNSAGKALMMFKTWLPMQFYQRFATEQDDIQSGTMNYKGRYWSYSAASAATHFGVVGLAAFGPLGAIVGGGLGYGLGKMFGTTSDIGFIKEVIETNKQLFKKALGMPINLLSGKNIIGSDKAFNNYIGKGDFTEQDAKNLRGNMADLAMQLAWIALILVIKSIFWDDDDESDDPDRITHNILINKLMQLSTQAGQYINPVDTYKSAIGSNGTIQYLTDVGKELTKVSEALHGRDIIQIGINAGESGLMNQTKKTFLPGIFKDSHFGFETQAERVFEESPFHPYFKSEGTLEKESNKRDRAERRLQLSDEGLDPKDILKILNEELPTPTQLKKKGMTREEYEEAR